MRLPLLPKIWLSTSVALTALFGLTGLVLQRQSLRSTVETLRGEIRDSFQAYESLWKARSETLGAISSVMSTHTAVRDVFRTGHAPTIKETAGEMWSAVSDQLRESAFFAVSEPDGTTVTVLESSSVGRLPNRWPITQTVLRAAPKQASGFFVLNDELYQLVLTPVYLDSTRGQELSKVLVAGFVVNHLVAQRLKASTGGSDFLFVSGDKVVASTLNDRATGVLRGSLAGGTNPELVSDGVSEYAVLERNLVDLQERPIGRLYILRSMDTARERLSALQRYLFFMWLGAVALGLAASYFLARRLVEPIRRLDRAAEEVTRQNYDIHVEVGSRDELGRLAATFNSMCSSLQAARRELIRQERISTIGRMTSSIVHDLRNPLAAIYGGAEMMVDTDLTPVQVRRIASNIYRSSRKIQEMLQDLLNLTRGKSTRRESCLLAEVIEAGIEPLRNTAQQNNVEVVCEVPADLELPLERARVERVFMNLVGNALEVMPGGGRIHIFSRDYGDTVEVDVADDGPGIPSGIRGQLFQPFATFGKKNGLGLGLALSRQSVLDHGGDLWAVDKSPPGATFRVRFPKTEAAPVSVSSGEQLQTRS
jgi:signal transduction histidine kinase